MSQPLPGLDRPVTLTERQVLALAFVRDRGPVSSDELGARLHADRLARGGRGRGEDERCDYCAEDAWPADLF